jgi:radical SAM superfamily enzyme YgiQ (UPF0313 family)
MWPAPSDQPSLKVSFADLTHTGRTVDANYFPLGCAFVTAYALKSLGNRISAEIFKYPEDFAAYLDGGIPDVACFSNYSWAFNLSYEYAKSIKVDRPETVVIFGGPNYPTTAEEQKSFLVRHPAIDFFIDGDGEEPMADLLATLIEYKLDVDAVKSARLPIAGLHYMIGSEFVHNPPPKRIKVLDEIPSPYLTGLLDKFFDNKLGPLMQSHRGCPYSCAYCHDGIDYMTKLGRFSHERTIAEIDYIFARHKTQNLLFADDNFGIYGEDVTIAKYLADLQEKHGWPAIFNASSAKNAKKRLSEIASILGKSYTVVASVQSTDPEVLKQIKRTNVPWDQMVELVGEVGKHGSVKLSEVILCLPRDTRERHFKSVCDLIDLGMDEIRMYQLIMLPGTEVASDEYRAQFGYQTKFRVMPRCIGVYPVLGEQRMVYEYHEICVGHDSMPHADYKACRRFNLLIEIFNNGAVFREALQFLESLGIGRSAVMLDLFDHMGEPEALQEIVRQFEADEDGNFFDSEADLKAWLAVPGTAERYVSGELGTNQMLRSRMLAHLDYFDEMLDFIFERARAMLEKRGLGTPDRYVYMEDLKRYLRLRKGNLLAVDAVEQASFDFDFVAMQDEKFVGDPLRHKLPERMEITFAHPSAHRQFIHSCLDQFGSTADGLGHLTQRGFSLWNLHKTPARV